LNWLRRHIPRTLKNVTAVVTVSEFSRSEIADCLGVNRDRIHVVPPGVPDFFLCNTDPEGFHRIKAKHHLPGKYILFVGTVEARKNIQNLLRAFEKNRAFFRREACKLLLVGTQGWMYDRILHTMHRYALQDDVLLAGYVEDRDLPYLYQGAEYLVSPSYYEGFGLPLLEAMASSQPIIASDIASHREILGDAAILFEPDDVDGLAASMKDLYQDHEARSRLIEKGNEKKRFFSWRDSASKMVQIYRRYADKTG
jgi:glycosyltransferase involved in cell wall biosynthesis